jgi:hypothetical protein
MLGARDDVPRLLAACDVVVHASVLAEPFGRVLVEAMLAGRPVVATRAGGVPEVVTDGETGVLVPPGDARALTEALDALRRDPARIAQLAVIYRKANEFTKLARTRADELDKVQRSSFYLADHFDQLPCVALPLVHGRPPTDGGAFFQASMWGSVFPTVWSFMLACRLHDLGTVLTTLALFYEDEILDLLGVDRDTYTLSCIVPVAHLRDPSPSESPRDGDRTHLHWNQLPEEQP